MEGLWRLIDANANRAREGLRVMEDVARFVLDDSRSLEQLKGIRHALTSALRAIDPKSDRLVGSRDVQADAGTSLHGSNEYERNGLPELIAANAKRAQESLRAIEEACKALDGAGDTVKSVEQARYRAYECEQRLVRTANARTVARWPLCVIVTRSLCTHMDWQDVIRASAEGGATCFQLREKGLSSRELTSVASEFVDLCNQLGVCSIINDRADIALLAGADGVHVGLDDPPIAQLMDTFGDKLIVGASAPSVAHAHEAIAARAHYLGVGAMFETSTKEKTEIAGPALLREVLAMDGCPHVLAIGGISAGNIDAVMEAGGAGVAVSSAICGSANPADACASMIGAITNGTRKEAGHADHV